MKYSYYIVMLCHTSIFTNKTIRVIDDQPQEGFATEQEAEQHMAEMAKEDKYPFRLWYKFTIMKLYEKIKE